MIAKQSKMPRYFPYLVAGCLLVWLGLTVDRVFLFQNPQVMGRIAAQLEFIVNILVFISAIKIYNNVHNPRRKIIWLMILISIGLFITDLYWYFNIYFATPSVSQAVEKHFLLDSVALLIWVVPVVVFLFVILKYYIFGTIFNFRVMGVFIGVNAAIILLFLLSVKYANELFSLATLSQIMTFVILVVVFDFVILCLISAEHKGLIFYILGIIGMIAGDFSPVYIVLSKTYVLPGYAELVWFLGLLLNWFGIIMIQYDGDYNIKHWVRKNNSIKSKFILWCFGMAIVSFLFFFMFAYAFSIISKAEFLGLPLFVMIYSAIVIVLSMYLGRHFEEPFKQIAGNINTLILDDETNSFNKIHTHFETEEFNFLQKFIVDAFSYRKKKEQESLRLERFTAECALKEKELLLESEANKAIVLELENDANKKIIAEQEKFAKQARQVMHDITSPVSTIDIVLAEQGQHLPENGRVSLRNACARIKDIANNLLNQYASNRVSQVESKEILVSLAVLQIVSEKRTAFQEKSLIIESDISNTANFDFIVMDRSVFHRMLSNVINNAVDALQDKVDGKIIVRVSSNTEDVIIIVKDNGPGIPKHIQEKFQQGIGVTEGKGDKGHGIGLTQVHEAVNSAGGKCMVQASQNGTSMMFTFPKAAQPLWLTAEIKLTIDDTVVILDDDESIHTAWDGKFAPVLDKYPQLKIQHFHQGQNAIDYLNALTLEQKANTYLLTDYELLHQNGMTGLDVVAQTGIKRAALVTSYAVDPSIQERVLAAGIKLLPKELVAQVGIHVDKKLVKWSRHVDIVWVEDQEWYVDNLVQQYYHQLKVDKYTDPEQFMADVIQYPLDTRIILDTYYETPDGKHFPQTGYTLAEELHKMGYTKLVLFSGDGPDKWGKIPDYLKIVHKGDREGLKHLDTV